MLHHAPLLVRPVRAIATWLAGSLLAFAGSAAVAAPTPAPAAGQPAALTRTIDGQTVAYLKAGRGPAVVIVHGLGGHKEDFIPVIVALSAHHTVLAPDMLGFGGSSRSADSVGPNAQARMIHGLLAAERVPAASIVGNSAGAWAAAAYAVRYPKQTRKLVLIDAAGLKLTLAGPPPVNFAPTTVEEMSTLLKTVIASPFAHTPEFATDALRKFQASGEAASLAKLFADFQRPDSPDPVLDELLPKIAVPTLVVWGEQDGLFPVALADVVTGGIRGARKVVIPGASHFPQVDAPDALAKVLTDFLAGR